MTKSGWFNQGSTGETLFSKAGFMNPWQQRLRQGGFLSVELNAVGWVAVIGPGVVLGLLYARLTDRSFVVWGLLGGLAIWLAAVVVDNLRYGRRPGRYVHTPPLSPDTLERFSEATRHAGIKFTHELIDTEDGPASVLHTKQKNIQRISIILRELS